MFLQAAVIMDSIKPTKTLMSFIPPNSFLVKSTFRTNLHSHIYNRNNSLRIVSEIKKTSKELKNNKLISKKIILSEGAPSISEEENVDENKKVNSSSVGNPVFKYFKRVPRKVLSILSNLPLAIGEMFTIAALMALGTAIDQGEAPEYYFKQYPEDNPVLGIFTWRWVLGLGFDHMFSSPVFLGMLVLLGASLMACTYTTQIPLVRVARRWGFMHSPEAIRKQEFTDNLPQASVRDLGVILMGAGYEVFLKGPTLYAFKGMAGRFAPIGVHIAMLLIMAGGTLSATGSFRGSVTVPQGLNFVMGDVLGPNGFLSKPTPAFNTEVHVNKFIMEYYNSGEISQYRTDLSLFGLDGKEVMRKTISVNDPLRYGGITIYQTDWSISALQVLKNDQGPFNLAVARLKLNGDKKLFGTFLPIRGNADAPDVKGISMLARDLQSIILYDEEGKFVGVRRPNSKLPIDINGTKIEIVDAIGSTGLDLKTDPGVPIVYAGFGALMLTTCISYLSHSQAICDESNMTALLLHVTRLYVHVLDPKRLHVRGRVEIISPTLYGHLKILQLISLGNPNLVSRFYKIWALQYGTTVVIGGKSNRAKIEFPEEMNRLLDQVPEIINSPAPQQL